MGEGRTEPNNADRRDRRRLTVPEAATVLGVTVDAVRGRIRRGRLEAEHDEHGTVYVFLDAEETDRRGPSEASHGPSPTVEEPSPTSRLVEALEDRIASLERQLEDARATNRENRRLLAAAMERIPAIEAPTGPPEPSYSAAERRSDPAKSAEEEGLSAANQAEQKGDFNALLSAPKDRLSIGLYVTLVFISVLFYFFGTAVPILSLLTYMPVLTGLYLGLKRRGRPYAIYALTAAVVGLANLAAVIAEGLINGFFGPLWESPNQWPMFLFFMFLLPSLMFGAGTLFGDVIKRKVWPVALAEPTTEQGTVETSAAGLSIPATLIVGLFIALPQVIATIAAAYISKGP